MPGRPPKEFKEYLCEATKAHVSHRDYMASPATAFLKYSVEAKSAIDLCIRKFPTNQNGEYSSDSLDSLQHLTTAILPAIMGHFETYQKNLFAGMIDLTVFNSNFKVSSFAKKLNDGAMGIDMIRLFAYRNIGASVGSIIADNLSSWHDPERVNKHFGAFGFNYTFYSNDDCKKLKVLWQLRHSIVHTGGSITLPDAQKVEELKTFGDRKIAFEKNFIFEVSRKLHPIVKRSTTGIGDAFKANLHPNLDAPTTNKINKFFEVKSSIATWLV